MAILSVTETWAGETASNQSDLTRTYARTFQVISDTPLEMSRGDSWIPLGRPF